MKEPDFSKCKKSNDSEVSTRVTNETKKKIISLAKKHNTHPSKIVREILEAYFDD